MKHSLLFLTLKVFSATGGIEKVSRLAGKALGELGDEQGFDVTVYSAYDESADIDPKYFSPSSFKGFGADRSRFVLHSIKKGRGASVVLLSHINLLSIGYVIKQLSPSVKLVLLAHGIEVWRPLSALKRRMLEACDLVMPVSHFTKEKMMALYGLSPAKFHVVNNCLDPFLQPPQTSEKGGDLLKRYGLSRDNKILLTLTRLSHKERYKGYDEVLMALKALKKEIPELRYLIVGKYDTAEKARLDRLVLQQGLEDEVVFAGFVPDNELAAHFCLSDIYVMPSRKEGFGIVFIEALFYGKPVIAGNVDGSVDALAAGKFGFLVNPDHPEEIKQSIKHILAGGAGLTPLHDEVVGRFGFPVYKNALWQALQSFITPQLTLSKQPVHGEAIEE